MLAAMGEAISRDDLVRRVAERLDLEPAMVMGGCVASGRGPARGAPTAAAGADRGGERRAAAPRRADLARAPRAGAAGDVHRAARRRGGSSWRG